MIMCWYLLILAFLAAVIAVVVMLAVRKVKCSIYNWEGPYSEWRKLKSCPRCGNERYTSLKGIKQ